MPCLKSSIAAHSHVVAVNFLGLVHQVLLFETNRHSSLLSKLYNTLKRQLISTLT